MKLRNKKTGEIAEAESCNSTEETIVLLLAMDGRERCEIYNSLAELNADWEDAKPTEPLIKNEKIRKAVRVWAEANEFEPNYKVKYLLYTYGLTSWQADIEFNFDIKELEDGKEYTIAELCGEEK